MHKTSCRSENPLKISIFVKEINKKIICNNFLDFLDFLLDIHKFMDPLWLQENYPNEVILVILAIQTVYGWLCDRFTPFKDLFNLFTCSIQLTLGGAAECESQSAVSDLILLRSACINCNLPYLIEFLPLLT